MGPRKEISLNNVGPLVFSIDTTNSTLRAEIWDVKNQRFDLTKLKRYGTFEGQLYDSSNINEPRSIRITYCDESMFNLTETYGYNFSRALCMDLSSLPEDWQKIGFKEEVGDDFYGL